MTNGEQMTLDLLDVDTSFGKTCQERCHQTTAKTSGSSSKKSVKSQTRKFQFLDLTMEDGRTQEPSWDQTGVIRSHGELWTPNFGESPKDAVESHLSQILEATPHPKYYLSARACDGVMGRADRRWKTNFPVELREALQEQSDYLTAHPNAINEATEWYESHPNAINDKTGTLVAGISKQMGNTQDNTLCYETKMWDGKDVAPTLTKNNAGGGQRMPDKDNFNCVVDRRISENSATLGVNCGMTNRRNGVMEIGGWVHLTE